MPEIIYPEPRTYAEACVAKAIVEVEARVEKPKMRVAGVSIGGCVWAVGTDRKGAFRRQAHAHTHATDVRRGWVCVLSGRTERLVTPTGKATRLLIHEIAHVATLTGHDDAWRAMVARLGAPSEATRHVRRVQRRVKC
jgi:hypothetical protein